MDELRGDSISKIDINNSGQLEIETSYSRRNSKGEYLQKSSVYKTENTVLPEFVHGSTTTISYDSKANVTVSKTSNPKEWSLNFAIPSGRDAEVSVSRTITLEPDKPAAVINESSHAHKAQLRFEIPKGVKGDKGDENIHIGCNEPTDKNKIWYDCCDYSVDEFSAIDMLYTAYLQTPGKVVEDLNSETGFKNV